jgi:ribosomal protein L40E
MENLDLLNDDYCDLNPEKICDSCGAANLPNVKSCRKCGASFKEMNKKEEKITPVYQGDYNSQQKVKAKLIEAIKNADTKIITVLLP